MVGVTEPSFVGERVHACAVHCLVASSRLSLLSPSSLSSLSPLSLLSLSLSLSRSLSHTFRSHTSPLLFSPYFITTLSLSSLSFPSPSLPHPPPTLSLPPFFQPTYRTHHSSLRKGQSQGNETRIHIEKGSSDRGGDEEAISSEEPRCKLRRAYKLRAGSLSEKKSIDSDFHKILHSTCTYMY